jgi:hypothetical protein
VCRLFDDRDFAARLTRQARQTLLDRYDIRSIADRILATVEDLPMTAEEETRARPLAS